MPITRPASEVAAVKRHGNRLKLLSVILSILLLSACQSKIPREALMLTPESLKHRQLQTRRFETADEKRILSASAALLQDLGFTIEESETELGVLLGCKTRSAVKAAQVVGAVLFAVMTGIIMSVDKDQIMRASVVTRPADPGHHIVRVTFQRVVFNTMGQVCRREMISDVKIYEDFFERLSKSVFLEAQGV